MRNLPNINEWCGNVVGMIISHQHKFVYFDNPMAGADELRRHLAHASDELVVEFQQRTPDHPFYHHMTPIEARRTFDMLNWNFSSYRRITCVRNPFVRLPAAYLRIRSEDPIWRFRQRAGLGVPDFLHWLEETRPDGVGGGGKIGQRWRRYATWSMKSWAGDAISTVLRVEDLQTCADDLFAELGVKRATHRIAESVYADASVLICDAAARLIEERYAEDLRNFGYHRPELTLAA